MEDRRIIKTKKTIKSTLIGILQEMPFEKITVTEICSRGIISRITFYTHYEDKYVLAEELFSDYIAEEDNTPDVETDKQYIPVTYYTAGRTGNNIQYLTKEEIIADVLREYERYISIVSDEENAMLFIDKKKYRQ